MSFYTPLILATAVKRRRFAFRPGKKVRVIEAKMAKMAKDRFTNVGNLNGTIFVKA